MREERVCEEGVCVRRECVRRESRYVRGDGRSE